MNKLSRLNLMINEVYKFNLISIEKIELIGNDIKDNNLMLDYWYKEVFNLYAPLND